MKYLIMIMITGISGWIFKLNILHLLKSIINKVKSIKYFKNRIYINKDTSKRLIYALNILHTLLNEITYNDYYKAHLKDSTIGILSLKSIYQSRNYSGNIYNLNDLFKYTYGDYNNDDFELLFDTWNIIYSNIMVPEYNNIVKIFDSKDKKYKETDEYKKYKEEVKLINPGIENVHCDQYINILVDIINNLVECLVPDVNWDDDECNVDMECIIDISNFLTKYNRNGYIHDVIDFINQHKCYPVGKYIDINSYPFKVPSYINEYIINHKKNESKYLTPELEGTNIDLIDQSDLTIF